MENESAFSRFLSQLGDKISEQVWYQQLKSKWDELDPTARNYAVLGTAAVTVLAAIGLLATAFFSVQSQKKELAEKQELIRLIQTANDEMRAVRNSGANRFSGDAAEADAPWAPYLQSTATNAGIDASKVAVAAEKVAPAPTGKAAAGAGSAFKESLIDVSLKKVNIKEVVRYAVQLENGTRPVKLRNLTIDTQADMSGYLDATLAVSAFSEKK